MTQVSVTMMLPNGSAIGTDEEGHTYLGTPRAVPSEALGVWTIPATDDDGGEAVHRINHDGDTIVGWGTLTRTGFLDSIRGLYPDEDEAALEARWQAEKATEGHQAQPEFAYRVFDWVEV